MRSAPAGAASASIPARISGTVIAGWAISRSASAPSAAARPRARERGSRISQRFSEGPSRRSNAGIALSARATLRRPEMTTPIATGPSRPGVATALAASIVSASVPAGRGDRAPGRPGGDRHGRLVVPSLGQLLAHARDHQQRVVDAERQAHHCGDRDSQRVDRRQEAGEPQQRHARPSRSRAPIASGTAAATGERNTSSSTRIRTGSAIISARSVSDIVASWIARPITATPVR